MEQFYLTSWKDHPTEKGIVTLDNTCTFEQLKDAVKKHLESVHYTVIDGDPYSLYDMLDYLHMSVNYNEGNKNIPYFRWIYCWPTAGASEGHYFHIECYGANDEKTHPLLLAKTLSGDTELALLINTEINRFILNIPY